MVGSPSSQTAVKSHMHLRKSNCLQGWGKDQKRTTNFRAFTLRNRCTADWAWSLWCSYQVCAHPPLPTHTPLQDSQCRTQASQLEGAGLFGWKVRNMFQQKYKSLSERNGWPLCSGKLCFKSWRQAKYIPGFRHVWENSLQQACFQETLREVL